MSASVANKVRINKRRNEYRFWESATLPPSFKQTVTSSLNILTVAEDNYKSDRITTYAQSSQSGRGVKLSFTDDSVLLLETFVDNKSVGTYGYVKLDINEIREFLNEAEQFISESQVIKRLMGNK